MGCNVRATASAITAEMSVARGPAAMTVRMRARLDLSAQAIAQIEPPKRFLGRKLRVDLP